MSEELYKVLDDLINTELFKYHHDVETLSAHEIADYKTLIIERITDNLDDDVTIPELIYEIHHEDDI